MSRDPARLADTQAWLRKAAGDMQAAEHDTLAQPPLHEDAVFHCQQVAEKSLKAFLTWRAPRGRRARPTKPAMPLNSGVV